MVNPRRAHRNPTLAMVGLGNPRGGGRTMARHHIRHHRRRRNPDHGGGGVQLLHPTSWAPLASGVAGAAAGAYAPKLVFGDGATTTQAYVIQALVAAGGSWGIRRYLGPAHANFFLAGAALPIASDIVRRAAAAVGVTVPGLGMYRSDSSIRAGALDARVGAAYYGSGSKYYMGSSVADEGVVGPGRYQAIGRYTR
jgi:hypothetical protein